MCEILHCIRQASEIIKIEDETYQACEHCAREIAELQHAGYQDEYAIREGVMSL